MNKVCKIYKYLIAVVIFFVSAFSIGASDSNAFEELDNDALQQILDNRGWNNPDEQEDIAFQLFQNARQEENALTESCTFQAIDIIEGNIAEREGTAEDYWRMAEMYGSLISDGPSWMKYHSKEESYLYSSLALNPEHKGSRIIHTRNLLNYPSSAGGDQKTGLIQLEELNRDFPDDEDVLLLSADYYLDQQDYGKAKEYYHRVMVINPANSQSKQNYEKLELLDKKLPINSILISGEPKTRIRNIMDKIRNLEGETYNREVIENLETIMSSKPAITNIEIETKERDDQTVDLTLQLDENNSKVYGILLGMGVANSSKSTPTVDGFPLFLYMDQNLFGSGNELSLMTAGVFLGLEYRIPERRGFPVDLSFEFTGLFIPDEFGFIEKGRPTDWDIKSPEYNTSFMLEKTTPIGLAASTSHNFRFNNFSGGHSDFITPENNVTYEADLQLGFSTLESGMPSAFSPPTGFAMTFTPALVLKPDYKDWGPENNLYSHNENPEGKFRTTVEYYMNPVKRAFLGGSISHLSAVNSYETEQWTIGQTDMTSTDPRLSGYLAEEFRSTNGVVANLDSHFQLVPDTILVSAKHDLFYDIDENKVRQGSALGLSFRLPYDIEMNTEAGIGWNAERKGDPAWNVHLSFSRFFLR